MSDLARSAMSARIAKLPHLPDIPAPTAAPYREDEEEGEEEEEENDDLGQLPSTLSGSSAYVNLYPSSVKWVSNHTISIDEGMHVGVLSSASKPSKSRPHRRLGRAAGAEQADLSDYAPISASAYFAQALSVAVPPSHLEFRVYYTSPKGTIGDEKEDQSASTVLVCHHGAGNSGLSFACFAREVVSVSEGELGVLALDARSHGKTTMLSPKKELAEQSLPSTSAGADAVDLSIEALTRDFVNLIQAVYPEPSRAPSLLLLGHSMGGTVLVRASPTLLDAGYRISGVIVLDVVEGSALEAMPMMRGLLASRPAGFDTIEDAVEWHTSNKTIRNRESARVSVPSLFKPSQTATEEFAYVWRTPLQLTEPFWSGWFTGLSASFLAARAARLLILAGTDRLDKTLMIGQMQGKFQLEVVSNVGHMLHEDNPGRIAEIVVAFWKRNERLVLPVGIKVRKVGES